MTTLCFFSATGGELTLVSQALSRLRTIGLDITLFGRTKEQVTDPEPVSYTHLTLPTNREV